MPKVIRDHHNLRRNLNLNGNYISNDGGDEGIKVSDAGDVTAGKMTLDVNYTGTTTENSKGLWIDYDATGDTGSSQNIVNTCLYTTVHSNAQTNAGTVTNYGVYSVATGGTSGTQTSVGAYVKATGADSNYALVTDGGNVGIGTTTPDTLLHINGTAKASALTLYEDASNYTTMNVEADGQLQIEALGTDPDILLKAGEADAEGDIMLQAMHGDVFMYVSNDYTNAMHFDVGSSPFFKMRKTALDWAVLTLGSNADLTITTVHNGGDDGHLTLDIDGDIISDSHSGNFIAKKAGTEFSAANSAYAGMILGYTRIQNDGTASAERVIQVDDSMTVIQTDHGTNVSIAFTAPPSGNIEVEYSCHLFASSRTVTFALSDNSTFNEIDETHTYDAVVVTTDETDADIIIVKWAVTGLTAGTAYTYYIAAQASANYANILHGRNRTTGVHYPPILVKATALPATIVTGE